MILYKYSKDLGSYLEEVHTKNGSIGFVPTMGALHDGHLSLIETARQQNDLVVCSIFVNPVQFNNKDDFKNYPSTIEHDILTLEENGCDVLFMPDESEIYPDEASRQQHYQLGYLEEILEGKFRPGHFQGVCLIVDKLLDIVQPGKLYLGQKDYQQCMVIKTLVDSFHKDINVVICPIIREANGLAMSSRNLRLDDEEKETAASLHKALVTIKEQIKTDNFLALKDEAIADLEAKGFRVDYLELADRSNLQLANCYENDKAYIVLIAAYLGDVRLIDNLLLKG